MSSTVLFISGARKEAETVHEGYLENLGQQVTTDYEGIFQDAIKLDFYSFAKSFFFKATCLHRFSQYSEWIQSNSCSIKKYFRNDALAARKCIF